MSASPGRQVAVQQPGLPWYRIGLFDRIAAELEAELHVFYDTARPNAKRAASLDGRFLPTGVRDRHLLGGRLIWSGTQIRLATSRNWDWVVLSWNSRYASLPLALIAARIRGNRVALWGHGYSPTQGRFARRYRTSLARLGSRLLLYSERGAEGLPMALRHRVLVVGNTQFRAVTEGSARRSRCEDSRRLVILHVGQLRSDRGLELALQALDELVRRGWEPRLIVVGDGPARTDLERRASRLGIASRVEFTGAIYDDLRIRTLHDCADVATFGARGGLGVVDALQHAVPVVLWGERSSQPPEADIVYERFPDLVDVDATATGVADCFERAVAEASIPRRVNEVAGFLESENRRVVARFVSALSPLPKEASRISDFP